MEKLLTYCQLAQRGRLSRNRALLMYRAAGGQIRTADFVRVWRAAQASRRIAGLPGERAA